MNRTIFAVLAVVAALPQSVPVRDSPAAAGDRSPIAIEKPAPLGVAPAAAIGGAPPAGAVPKTLAAVDFDGDGVTDLAVGYGTPSGGSIVLLRGNIRSIYPHAAPPGGENERWEGAGPAPFLGPAQHYALPECPDFLAAADFDNDGRADILAARAGSTRLELLRGDGEGRLGSAETREIAGSLTALAAADINRRDGLIDVVVAVRSGAATRALVFESPRGAWGAEPEVIELPAPGSSVELGDADLDSKGDLLFAAGREIVLVRGRDRRLAWPEERRGDIAPARVERFPLDFEASDMKLGRFEHDGTPRLALLAPNGSVHLAHGWNEESFRVEATATSGTALVAASISGELIEDLVVVDRERGALRTRSRDAGWRDLEVGRAPQAILPLRLNQDGRDDLVVLDASGALAIALTAPLATFVVTSTDDAGEGSLHRVLIDARAAPGPDTITFNIPGSGPHTIALQSPLPQIIETVTLDATTQPGYAGSPLIALDGVGAGAGDGLEVAAGNCVIRGLAIHRFSQNGIRLLDGADNAVIESNHIGTDVNGTVALGNGGEGILVAADNPTIGGAAPAARNVISGNGLRGLRMEAGDEYDAVDSAYFDCYWYGPVASVAIDIPDDFTISDVNVASVSVRHQQPSDIWLALQGPDGTEVYLSAGNGPLSSLPDCFSYFETEFDDEAAAPLTSGTSPFTGSFQPDGLLSTFDGSSSQGTWTLWVYDVSHFGDCPCGFERALYPFSLIFNGGGASGAVIRGNYIGTTASGLSPLGNAAGGVSMPVGSSLTVRDNVISGNTGPGIEIDSAVGTLIQGNKIGVDATGASALPNTTGVMVTNTDSAVIGGTAAGQGNVISGNQIHGVRLENTTAGVLVQGNLVGTDGSGAAGVGNGSAGIQLCNAVEGLVGGAVLGARNVISANGTGVEIDPQSGCTPTGQGVSNIIQGNYIGTDAGGNNALGNQTDGVRLGSHFNLVEGNVISGNEVAGLMINDDIDETDVRSNIIGLSATGASPVPNGYGVRILGPSTRVWSNTISGNLLDGVTVEHGASSSLSSNTIAFNTGAGLRVESEVAFTTDYNSTFHGNGGLGIDLGPQGPTPNDPLDADTGANDLLNAPEITAVSWLGSDQYQVSGSYHGTPNTMHSIRLFANSTPDPSGYGEGQEVLGSVDITTDSAGNASFSTTVTSAIGDFFAAIALWSGHPSEFSAAVPRIPPPQEARDISVSSSVLTPSLLVDYVPACGATDHAIYWGTSPIASGPAWTNSACGLGTTGAAVFDPGIPAAGQFIYFVVVGYNESGEGPYGLNSAGSPLPEATGVGACDRPLVIGGTCP